MSARLPSYALAAVAVIVTAVVRFALIPLLGNRFGFDFFLISTFICCRYLGFGPSLFALLAGAVPVTIFHLVGPDLYDPYFPVGLAAYLVLGAIVVLLGKSEQAARSALGNEIQERKAAERAVRASEARLQEREETLRLAADSGNIGIWDFNPLTGEHKWSSRSKTMFGLPPDANLDAAAFLERVLPEDRDRVNQAMLTASDPTGNGEYEVEYRIVRPDATVRWILARGQAVFEGEKSDRRAARRIGTVLDVTERKQAEERFRKVALNAPVGIFETDHQGCCRFVNEAWCEIAGATLEDALGDGWQRFLHPEDRQRVLEEWRDATIHLRNHVTEFRFSNRQTGVRWVIASATIMLDSTSGVSAYVGTIVDVTQRKAAEDAVRASEARLREILDHMPAAISLKDLEGRYLLVNRGFEDLLGVRNDEISGLTNYESISETGSHRITRELADRFVKIDRKVIRTGEIVTFEDSMPTGDDPRLFATVKFPIKDSGGKITGVGGVSIDVTDRRKAMDSLAAEQELLRHTIELQDHERQLVAYEIHDGLVQYATGALMRLEGIQDRAASESIAEQIENVVDILRKTVAEGRRIIGGIHATILDDCGVVAAVQQLIEDEERAHVAVEFVKDEGLGRMAPKIEEALYRITQEALTNVGKHSQSTKVRVELSRRADRVHLQVRDWGVGFAPPTNARGVHGLRGMAERARIAGGRCTVENAAGGGTQVVVDLPYLSRK